VSTGLFDRLDPPARERLVDEPFPSRATPMLAVLTHDRFDHPDWIYERKLDGQRVLFALQDGQGRLRSRNGEVLDATYPELVEALEATGAPDLVADGEVVAFDGDVTSFARLQRRMGVRDARRARLSGVAVHAYLFDLLHLDGRSTRRLTLRDRKRLLRAAIDYRDPLRFTTHRAADGLAFLEEACAKGWEGLIAKDATSTYTGDRSKAWLKFKCGARQELVVGGFTEPKGSRTGFGALLVGYHEDGALRYAGKVGTGYDHVTLRSLGARLQALERDTSPFSEPIRDPSAHFVAPDVVVEVTFTEWTRDGRLRHPSYVGLRDDKDPLDVVREG
jgi:bifunctional non-homologous end joining protein LigD